MSTGGGQLGAGGWAWQLGCSTGCPDHTLLACSKPALPAAPSLPPSGRIIFQGVHHVALLCASLERSLDFYCGVLGLEVGRRPPVQPRCSYQMARWAAAQSAVLEDLPHTAAHVKQLLPLVGKPCHGSDWMACHPFAAQINPDRPHNKLPYRGAWLWIGPEMIHLMVSCCCDAVRPGCCQACSQRP